MIIGIVKVGAGVVALEEWRDTTSAADAVAAFCGEYATPKDPAGYLGIETDWDRVRRTSDEDALVWCYDFDAGQLIEAPPP